MAERHYLYGRKNPQDGLAFDSVTDKPVGGGRYHRTWYGGRAMSPAYWLDSDGNPKALDAYWPHPYPPLKRQVTQSIWKQIAPRIGKALAVAGGMGGIGGAGYGAYQYYKGAARKAEKVDVVEHDKLPHDIYGQRHHDCFKDIHNGSVLEKYMPKTPEPTPTPSISNPLNDTNIKI